MAESHTSLNRPGDTMSLVQRTARPAHPRHLIRTCAFLLLLLTGSAIVNGGAAMAHPSRRAGYGKAAVLFGKCA